MTVIDCPAGFLLPDEVEAFKKIALASQDPNPASIVCPFLKPFYDKSILSPDDDCTLWLLVVNNTGEALTDADIQLQWGNAVVQTSGGVLPAPLSIYDKLPAGSTAAAGDVVLSSGDIRRKTLTCPSFGIYAFSRAKSGLIGSFGAISFHSKALGSAPGCTIGWASFCKGYCNTETNFTIDAAAMAVKMNNASKLDSSYFGIGPSNGMGVFSNVTLDRHQDFSVYYHRPIETIAHVMIAYIGPYKIT